MLEQSKQDRAFLDVSNTLFEIGILDAPTIALELSDALRGDLDIDSQELVDVSIGLSSLATSGEPLNESEVCTVADLVDYLVNSRDAWLPKDVPYVFQGSATINCSIEFVRSCIANYRKWPEILAHVKKIEPEYDDGRFQSFKMHIEELTTKENYFVQSWRYLNIEEGIIDFTQPKPPAGFRVHKGGWRFKVLEPNKTELISFHGFDLNNGVNVEDAMALIRKHIQAALKTWVNHGNAID